MEPAFAGLTGRAAARLRTALPWSLLAALLVAGCGGGPGPGTAGPATAGPATAIATAGLPAATAAAGPTAGSDKPATAAEILAFAESLAPPGGVERLRTTNDGSTLMRWISTDSMEALDAHYQRVVDEGGLDAVRTMTGPILTFIFTSTDTIAAAGSIQVTVAPGEGHSVSVSVSTT